MSIDKAIKLIKEPRRLNAAQIIGYVIVAACGFMAVLGVANPLFMATTIGPKLIAAVGYIMMTGGVVGAYAVFAGMWGVERLALWLVGLGLFALLPAAVFYSFNGRSPAIWIVLALICLAILDVYKRYHRIGWAYLDPTRP